MLDSFASIASLADDDPAVDWRHSGDLIAIRISRTAIIRRLHEVLCEKKSGASSMLNAACPSGFMLCFKSAVGFKLSSEFEITASGGSSSQHSEHPMQRPHSSPCTPLAAYQVARNAVSSELSGGGVSETMY